jgi:hypothetical protein
MSNGFLQKLEMMGETSIYSLEEELIQDLMKQKMIHLNTNGLRRILSHKICLMHGKKRKHLKRPNKSFSRK